MLQTPRHYFDENTFTDKRSPGQETGFLQLTSASPPAPT